MIMHPKKIGVLCSAGGSAFFSAVDIFFSTQTHNPKDFFLITDRPCGAEELADSRGIARRRLESSNIATFSKLAADEFKQANCHFVIMYYSKLVTKELLLSLPTLNIHPSLLPAFKGIGAAKMALDAKARFLGATLHLATDEMDGGPIVAQVTSPWTGSTNIEIQKLSYLQKVYLSLVAVELLEQDFVEIGKDFRSFVWKKKPSVNWSANPALASLYGFAFNELQKKLDVEVAVFP